MVGEAGGPGLQARRARQRLGAAAGALAALAALSCAFQGDPPGGPPDTTPPTLVSTEPESGAVLTVPPHDIELYFDEVVGERIAATPPDIGGAVLLSPATGAVSVGWHRSRLSVNLKGGFRPGRIYRLELLPVISDLRSNRMRTGRTIVFSTGPQIPQARLSGTVVDWVGGRAAIAALIEAVLLPDSLPYRTLADSTGSFAMGDIPAGEYLVYGVVDQNGNRRREPREAFDTARVTLADSARVELYAFTHDTVGPRPRGVEAVDSVTLRVTFDRPIDPATTVDTSMLQVFAASDTTAPLALTAVLTPARYDSLIKAEAAARAARDTLEQRRAAPPQAAAAPPAPAPNRTPAPRRQAPPPLGAAPGPQRPESTVAMRMLARRPAPTDLRVVRLAAPLEPGARYLVVTHGVIGLAGAVGSGRVQLRAPQPPPPPRRDTLRGPAARPPDTARAGRPPAGRDSTPPARKDTLPERPAPGTRSR